MSSHAEQSHEHGVIIEDKAKGLAKMMVLYNEMTKTAAEFGLTPPSPAIIPHQITTVGLPLPTSMIDNFPTFLNLHAAMQE